MAGSVAGSQTSVSMPLTMPVTSRARARITPSNPIPKAGVISSSA